MFLTGPSNEDNAAADVRIVLVVLVTLVSCEDDVTNTVTQMGRMSDNIDPLA